MFNKKTKIKGREIITIVIYILSWTKSHLFFTISEHNKSTRLECIARKLAICVIYIYIYII